MGFLSYWRDQPKEEVQGNLLQPTEGGDAVVDRTEPSRLASYHRLHDELKKRGATDFTHAAVNHIQNAEVLGNDYGELYEVLNLSPGQRANLPREAKEALMVGDIAAFHQIMLDNAEGHAELIESSSKGFRRSRKLFPW